MLIVNKFGYYINNKLIYFTKPSPSPFAPACSKYWFALIIVMAILGLAGCSKAPDPGLNAYQALKRLELRTNRLVWHQEYASDLDQAKSAVEAYSSGKADRAQPGLRACLDAALFDYQLAGKLWELLRQAGQNGSAQNIRRVCLKRTSATGGLLVAYLKSLDALPPVGADGCSLDEIEITGQVSFLWDHASGEMRKASQILGQ